MSCHLNLRRSDGWIKLLRRLPLTKMVKDELMWLEPNRSEWDFFFRRNFCSLIFTLFFFGLNAFQPNSSIRSRGFSHFTKPQDEVLFRGRNGPHLWKNASTTKGALCLCRRVGRKPAKRKVIISVDFFLVWWSVLLWTEGILHIKFIYRNIFST